MGIELNELHNNLVSWAKNRIYIDLHVGFFCTCINQPNCIHSWLEQKVKYNELVDYDVNN